MRAFLGNPASNTGEAAGHPNIESLILDGTAINGGGNSDGNAIIGNASGNIIDGKAGADLMQGGAGDDIVDNAGDSVVDGTSRISGYCIARARLL